MARAERIVERQIDRLRARVSAAEVSLRATPARISAQMGRSRDRLSGLSVRADAALKGTLGRNRAQLLAHDRMLQSLSYKNVLGRGYALVRDGEGQPLKAAAEVASGMMLSIEFADGSVDAVAGASDTPPAPRTRKTPKPGPGSGPPNQGSLF